MNRVVRAGWAAALLAVGAAQLAGAWSGWIALPVFIVAALLPVALVPAAVKLGLPLGWVVAALAALTVLGAYLATAATGGGLLTALLDAVPRLLTAPRPAPATPDLLMPGAVLAMILGLWVGARVCWDGALIAAPVGAAILYTGAALLTAGATDRYGVTAGGLLLLTVAGWILQPRSASAGPAVSAMACCAGVALLAGLLPLTNAFEPRRLVTPPALTIAEPSPMSRLATWSQQGDVELLRVRGDRRPVTLVTLPEFTGVTWRASGTYRPLGTVEEPALPAGQRRIAVDSEIRVGALEGPWLPSVGSTTEVSLNGVSVDPESGSAAIRDGLRAGLRYRIQGAPDAPTPEDIQSAGVPDAARYLATPGLPWQLAEYARQITHNAATPYEQAVAIEYAVRNGRRFDHSVPTGSSYARLTTFLAGTNESGAQAGTSEQFAAAFAVLARAAKLPTRIVVGFQPSERAPDGMLVARGRNAMAWPEVYFTGWGWQSFQPTPVSGAAVSLADNAAKQQVLARLAERSAAGVQPNEPAPTLDAPAPPRPPAAPEVLAAPGIGASALFLFASVVLVALMVPFALLATARGFRRARHRRAGPLGAWSEVLDLLVLLGRPAPKDQPAPETASSLAVLVPLGSAYHPAAWLAWNADLVAFGPGPHRADSRPWKELRLLRRAIHRSVPWHRRLLWPFDPRPLRRRSS